MHDRERSRERERSRKRERERERERERREREGWMLVYGEVILFVVVTPIQESFKFTLCHR